VPTALTADYQIANLALTRLGDLRLAALSDASAPGEAVSAVYASLRDEVLRAHPWNFAVQRATCHHVADAAKTITGITQAADAIVTTSTPHGYAVGDEVRLAGVFGMTEVNGLYFTVSQVPTATTFGLGVSSVDYTAYSSGGLSLRSRIKRLAETIAVTGATAANPCVLTVASGHGLVNGDEIYLAGIGGMVELNGRYFTIGATSATTLTLTGIDASAYGAFTTAGTAQRVLGELWDWTAQLTLPSDCLRVLEVENDDAGEWAIEAGGVLCVNDLAEVPADIRYIARVTDVSVYDPLFVDALAARLAAELAVPLAQDQALGRTQIALYEAKLAEARAKDALEQTAPDFDEDDWIAVRG
jgi:hypothetical protein